MMPDNKLASVANPSAFINAGALESSRVKDYEDGPVAIQDPSQGSMHQVWKAEIIGSTVYLSAPNQDTSELVTGIAVSDISIAFNQNAYFYYVWVDQGVTRLRWFDPTAGEYVITSFGTEMRTPKLTLDDKRSSQTGRSDVILAYIRTSDNKLCHRLQRDRFLIERVLADGPFVSIEKMYFNATNALQFLLTPGDPNA